MTAPAMDDLDYLARAIDRIWNDIAPDLPPRDYSSDEVVELCADAGRLDDYSNRAHAIFYSLGSNHGEMVRAAALLLPFAVYSNEV
jgi:hypothetical protein